MIWQDKHLPYQALLAQRAHQPVLNFIRRKLSTLETTDPNGKWDILRECDSLLWAKRTSIDRNGIVFGGRQVYCSVCGTIWHCIHAGQIGHWWKCDQVGTDLRIKQRKVQGNPQAVANGGCFSIYFYFQASEFNSGEWERLCRFSCRHRRSPMAKSSFSLQSNISHLPNQRLQREWDWRTSGKFTGGSDWSFFHRIRAFVEEAPRLDCAEGVQAVFASHTFSFITVDLSWLWEEKSRPTTASSAGDCQHRQVSLDTQIKHWIRVHSSTKSWLSTLAILFKMLPLDRLHYTFHYDCWSTELLLLSWFLFASCCCCSCCTLSL